jgi:tryptophan-rich sensory protein
MVARLLLGIGAAVLFAVVGFTLVTLHREDGAASVFYPMMGWFSFAMAMVAVAVALPRE